MKPRMYLASVALALAPLPALFAPQAVTVAPQSQPEQPPFPPPGKLVDIGGWRLHLNCTGEARASQPTVILEPGLGDFSVEWSLVQPGVAKFARVCSYDRAGDGWRWSRNQPFAIGRRSQLALAIRCRVIPRVAGLPVGGAVRLDLR